MRKMAIFGFIVAALGACTSQIQGRDVPETQTATSAGHVADGSSQTLTVAPRRLSGSEIGTLLIGRTLSFIVEPGVLTVTSSYRETYRADGTLLIAGDRGASRGRYRIASDRICLSVEAGPERCRYLVMTTEDQPYVVQIGPDGVEQPAVRIAIEDQGAEAR